MAADQGFESAESVPVIEEKQYFLATLASGGPEGLLGHSSRLSGCNLLCSAMQVTARSSTVCIELSRQDSHLSPLQMYM